MKNLKLKIYQSISFVQFVFLCFFLFSSYQCFSQKQVVLTVDERKTYQQMEGFGAFDTFSSWENETEANKYNLVVNDLGLSIMRFELPPTFYPVKDSTYNLNAEVFGTSDLQHAFKDVRELKKLGVKKFIASVWSPPAWMKTFNTDGKGPSTNKGGSLRADAYGDFAGFCAVYCKTFKQQTGIDLYAIGLQNEPEFSEPYNSCVYTPAQLREALRFVGRRFKKEGITTKIYAPEALPAQNHLPDFFNAINSDGETSKYADIFAIHNYDTDGINVGGAGSKDWQNFARLAASAPPAKQVWMTETSGHPNNWDGAMLLAANMYNAIQYGNLSAWLWWAIADNKKSEVFALIVDGKPTGRYYVSKHFYRFVRPGAVRVKASSNNPDLLMLAFIHSGNYKLVTILINKGKGDQNIILPGVAGKKEIYLSTSTSNCILQKSLGKKVKMPAQSIMTITWK